MFGVRHAPILADTDNISKRTEMRFHLTHHNSEFHRVHQNYFWAYGMFVQTVHLACVKISTIYKQTKTSF
jgi:hypothetical protein